MATPFNPDTAELDHAFLEASCFTKSKSPALTKSTMRAQSAAHDPTRTDGEDPWQFLGSWQDKTSQGAPVTPIKKKDQFAMSMDQSADAALFKTD